MEAEVLWKAEGHIEWLYERYQPPTPPGSETMACPHGCRRNLGDLPTTAVHSADPVINPHKGETRFMSGEKSEGPVVAKTLGLNQRSGKEVGNAHGAKGSRA